MITRDKVYGALARGYCYTDNSAKELDTKLIEAMADRIMILLKEDSLTTPQPDVGEKGEICSCVSGHDENGNCWYCHKPIAPKGYIHLDRRKVTWSELVDAVNELRRSK